MGPGIRLVSASTAPLFQVSSLYGFTPLHTRVLLYSLPCAWGGPRHLCLHLRSHPSPRRSHALDSAIEQIPPGESKQESVLVLANDTLAPLRALVTHSQARVLNCLGPFHSSSACVRWRSLSSGAERKRIRKLTLSHRLADLT